jgi:hypothetical protein
MSAWAGVCLPQLVYQVVVLQYVNRCAVVCKWLPEVGSCALRQCAS